MFDECDEFINKIWCIRNILQLEFVTNCEKNKLSEYLLNKHFFNYSINYFSAQML